MQVDGMSPHSWDLALGLYVGNKYFSAFYCMLCQGLHRSPGGRVLRGYLRK
jgi:hypothetical protein